MTKLKIFDFTDKYIINANLKFHKFSGVQESPTFLSMEARVEHVAAIKEQVLKDLAVVE